MKAPTLFTTFLAIVIIFASGLTMAGMARDSSSWTWWPLLAFFGWLFVLFLLLEERD